MCDVRFLGDADVYRFQVIVFRFKNNVTSWVKQRTGKSLEVVIPTTVFVIESVLSVHAP